MPKGFKVGGRVKGTPNKKTIYNADGVAETLQHEMAQFKHYMEGIKKPENKLRALSRFMSFVMPKFSAVDITRVDMEAKGGPKAINVNL